MHKIANGLHAGRPRLAMRKMLPCNVKQSIAVAISAWKQEDEGFMRQILDRILRSTYYDRIGQTAVVHDSVCREADRTGRRENSAAPVSEAVAITVYRHRRLDDHVVWPFEEGHQGRVDSQHQDDGCWLRKLVSQFVTDPQFHDDLSAPRWSPRTCAAAVKPTRPLRL